MAKSSSQSSAWSLEDMDALAREIESTGQIVASMKATFDSFQDRLAAMERKLVGVDLGDRQLPSEVVAGMSPAQFYACALTGALTAVFLGNPTILNSPDAALASRIRRVLDVAEMVLMEQLRRCPPRKK